MKQYTEKGVPAAQCPMCLTVYRADIAICNKCTSYPANDEEDYAWTDLVQV